MGMEKELFQITEAARACGLSRSTLLRMEEKGLLTPAYIAPDSGRRYYDNHNVARIMQIEKFKSMGISNEQIINYFVRGGEAADMLAALRDRILSDDPLFTISDRKDFLEGYIGKDPFSIDICVPLRADKAPAEAVVLPECRTLSVLYYGEYSGMDEAWLTLGREVKARGLKPIGPPRVLGIVAPYTGREINAQRYCSRLVLPVEEE